MKIAVLGASGKMGLEITKCAQQISNFELTLAVTKTVEKIKNFSQQDKLQNISKYDFDVAIDFTTQASMAEILKEFKKIKKPLISGTTGLTPNDLNQLEELGKSTPVLWSPNFSIGIGFLRQCIKRSAILSDFQFQISETHHVNKKDAPSGTAKILRDDIEKLTGRKIPEPKVQRIGEVIGDHQITIQGPFEKIFLEHQATSRAAFAFGALKAGQWLIDQPKGFYNFEDYMESVTLQKK